MSYSTSWVIHFRTVSAIVARIGGRATCNAETGALDIRARGRRVELFPQFGFIRPDGGIGYLRALDNNAEYFIGWRPYAIRFWPLSFDKRAFKAFCRGNGVAVPRQWNRLEDIEADVLIKRGVSSFSQGILGPYTPAALKRMGRALLDGEFFEEFIPGEIIKVWYWNAMPVCLEALPMSTVTGDGTRTLRQLIKFRKFPHSGDDWEPWRGVAEYQGLHLEAVVPDGREVLIEFRYQSCVRRGLPDYASSNVLAKYAATPLMEQLRSSSEVFWRAIPDAVRRDTLFTVDGILDRNGVARFVEMNSNPAVHPDAYAPMLESLFAVGAPGQAQRPPRAAPQAASVVAPAP